MAEPKTQPKRQREETQEEEEDNSAKRCKYSLKQIISILEDEEEDSMFNKDFSTIFTSLQQELSSSSLVRPGPDKQLGGLISPNACSKKDGVDDEIRHLLEASDDELGIPSSGMYGGDNSEEKATDGGDLASSLCDGLCELEDEAANYDYYSLLHSELFM